MNIIDNKFARQTFWRLLIIVDLEVYAFSLNLRYSKIILRFILYLYYTCTSDVQSVMQGYCTSFHSFYKQSFHHHWVQFLKKKQKRI